MSEKINIMKKIVFTTFLLVVCALTAYPQSYQPGSWQGEFSFSGGPGINSSNYSDVYLTIAPGYAFTEKLALRLKLDVVVGLYHTGKNYRTQTPLGLNLAYRANPNLELNASVGSTIYNQDKWNFAYYDLGLRWFAFPQYPYFYLGIGPRFQQMYNDYYKNRLTLNASFGVILHR